MTKGGGEERERERERLTCPLSTIVPRLKLGVKHIFKGQPLSFTRSRTVGHCMCKRKKKGKEGVGRGRGRTDDNLRQIFSYKSLGNYTTSCSIVQYRYEWGGGESAWRTSYSLAANIIKAPSKPELAVTYPRWPLGQQ